MTESEDSSSDLVTVWCRQVLVSVVASSASSRTLCRLAGVILSVSLLVVATIKPALSGVYWSAAPLVLLTILDASFHRTYTSGLEALYDFAILKGVSREEPSQSIDAVTFLRNTVKPPGVRNIIRSMFAPSVWPFYCALIALTLGGAHAIIRTQEISYPVPIPLGLASQRPSSSANPITPPKPGPPNSALRPPFALGQKTANAQPDNRPAGGSIANLRPTNSKVGPIQGSANTNPPPPLPPTLKNLSSAGTTPSSPATQTKEAAAKISPAPPNGAHPPLPSQAVPNK